MKFELPRGARGLLARRTPRTVIAVVAVVVVLLGGSAIWARWWREHHPTGILGAIAAMPTAVQRLNFTDWSAVRLELRVYRDQEVSTMRTWLPKAFDDDLSPASNMADSAQLLQQHFGFSPANTTRSPV